MNYIGVTWMRGHVSAGCNEGKLEKERIKKRTIGAEEWECLEIRMTQENLGPCIPIPSSTFFPSNTVLRFGGLTCTTPIAAVEDDPLFCLHHHSFRCLAFLISHSEDKTEETHARTESLFSLPRFLLFPLFSFRFLARYAAMQIDEIFIF